jgi:hypothetical protein
MAGFEYRDKDAKVTYGTISNPLTIKDSGNKCCDEVTVIYDYFDEESKKAERIRIRYWAGSHTSNKGSRHRLYKQKDILGQNKKILAKPKLGTKDVMADYIEDFQFESDIGKSSGGGCAPKDGWFCPTKVTTSCNQSDTTNIIDGNNKTMWQCDNETTITLHFGQKISKITDITIATGSVGDSDNPPWSKHAITGSGTLYWKGKKLFDTEFGRYGPPKNHAARGPCNDKLHWSYKKRIGGKDCSGISELKYIAKRSGLCYRWGVQRGGPLKGQTYCRARKWGGKPQLGLFKIKGKAESGSSSNSTSAGLDSKLVEIELVLRTKNQYGKDRQFKKKDYHAGNYKLDKTDKYKRDTFSSTVLVRNLAL